MGDFTNDDRNKLIETHTLIKSLVHRVDDHETRIRKNENIATKAIAITTLMWAGILAGIKFLFWGNS